MLAAGCSAPVAPEPVERLPAPSASAPSSAPWSAPSSAPASRSVGSPIAATTAARTPLLRSAWSVPERVDRPCGGPTVAPAVFATVDPPGPDAARLTAVVHYSAPARRPYEGDVRMRYDTGHARFEAVLPALDLAATDPGAAGISVTVTVGDQAPLKLAIPFGAACPP